MPGVDRARYMDAYEVGRLRRATQARARRDRLLGRSAGVLAWAVVDTALQTGLRVSELARLTVGDLDPDRGDGGALRIWRHKRRRPVRETLAISRSLAAHLRDFLAWKVSRGQSPAPAAALFVGKRGPLGVTGLQLVWKRCIAAAGLPRTLSIHAARHTLAVHLLRRTGNLRQVQKQLGHTHPAVTANQYADVSFEDMQAGLNGLYETLERGPSTLPAANTQPARVCTSADAWPWRSPDRILRGLAR